MMMRVAAKSLLARSLQQTQGSSALRAFVHVGDQIPNVELHKGFPPEKINLRDYCKGARGEVLLWLMLMWLLSLLVSEKERSI